jgi:hypothetical protein
MDRVGPRTGLDAVAKRKIATSAGDRNQEICFVKGRETHGESIAYKTKKQAL